MNEKPKLLILTDSVSLPRKTEKGYVKWEDTYAYQLRQKYIEYEIILVAIGAATIKVLRDQINYYKVLNPEIVILQCGIVDATPRAYGRIEMELIKKLKLFRLTKSTVSFLRKHRGHNYTSKNKFTKIIKEIKKSLNPNHFIGLGILPSCEAYEKKAPGITRNINSYNTILKENSNYVNLSEIPRVGVLNDYHHINELGHDYIFTKLIEKLDNV